MCRPLVLRYMSQLQFHLVTSIYILLHLKLKILLLVNEIVSVLTIEVF